MDFYTVDYRHPRRVKKRARRVMKSSCLQTPAFLQTELPITEGESQKERVS